MPTATEPSPQQLLSLHIDQRNALPKLIPRKKKAAIADKSLSPPLTPLLEAPPPRSSFSFTHPIRRILSRHDHDLFLSSPTYTSILSFVFSLSDAAANIKITDIDISQEHSSIREVLNILEHIEDTINDCPPIDQGNSRFGNPAFQQFIDSVTARSPRWHRNLDLNSVQADFEVSTYLEHSFGNRARIDYGSGHELNFLIWLLCLYKLSAIPRSTFPAITLVLFPRYIRLLRKIQSTYYLEPAGSHGVWGLDDYQFLPFLFGASQLKNHPYIRPLSIHNELVLEEEDDKYLYLDMVRFTMASKTVKGLKWTQPMLDDISGAKNWEKVEQGMRKMFVKEVLGKLPVMQHFLFGSIVPAAEGMSKSAVTLLAPEHEEKEGGELRLIDGAGPMHVHRNDAWGDCCGIKIPSTVAASQEEQKGDKERFRTIPFD